jgi:ribosomal protein S18 acetylase RimI-like enzyme
MSGSSDSDLRARLVRYELDHARDAAELVEPIDEGALVLNPEIGLVWSANYLEIRNSRHEAGQLAELADRLFGARRYGHRRIVPSEPEYSARLEPGFVELGWTVSRNVYMELRRPPDREGAPAIEVSRQETEPIRTATRSRRSDMTPKSVQQMHVWDARLDETAESARWFASLHEGKPASSCVLYERDGVGQVETVTTDPELEGRGLASGVVLAAAQASREAGHEITFLVADADDWPWKLYERLGFDRVGEGSSFLTKPPQPLAG